MAKTVSYSASLVTRKTNSSSNTKSDRASQEYYENTYNYVGIIHFSGMNLANKVITGISFNITSTAAGLGVSHLKTVYFRRSNYQAPAQSGVTGASYCGTALGTMTGYYYNNTSTNVVSGSLLTQMAAYFAQGNNTLCIYNPSPTASSHGYSNNYLQWSSVIVTVTYEEPSSVPTMSAYTITMGNSVTIYTNRQTTAATHTIRYSYFTVNETIATGVTTSCTWTPPVSLAAQTPSATSGWGTILCDTYVNGTYISTNTCIFTLDVPSSVVPSISAINLSEAVSGIDAQFGGYVQTRSKLNVSITAAGTQSSTITGYRTTVNGTTYTGTSFTTGTLSTAGSNTISVTVTDSRGRTATRTSTFTVLAYAPPSLTKFSAERCNSDGTQPQRDGTKVRVSITGSASSVNAHNTLTCTVYYKLTSATAWTQATTVTPSNYSIAVTNLLLSQTFNALNSYDLKVRVQDYFYYIEQTVSIATKQVMMDFYKDGSGIAFGKVAEQSGKVEFGWPVILSSALGIAYGGTGATTAAGAIANLGGVKKTGDTMTGNLNISAYLYPSLLLLPTYNDTTNRTVFEGSYVGASSFASWNDSSGNNRRMLEVRNSSYESNIDNAVMVRTCDNGTWGNYRVFHAGMATGVPVANGGTGATTAASARSNLGCNNASNLTTGTVPAARLPFKVAYGSANINGSTAASINYSSAGFTSVPKVIVTSSTTSTNWSGDNGAIKVYSKTTTGANIIVGGSFSTTRAVDWIAIGT